MNSLNLAMGDNTPFPKVHIRGLKKDGMTVRSLIHELQLMPMDCKVVWYDKDGSVHHVINAVRDGATKVGIF